MCHEYAYGVQAAGVNFPWPGRESSRVSSTGMGPERVGYDAGGGVDRGGCE
jgi:hypothetical protein